MIKKNEFKKEVIPLLFLFINTIFLGIGIINYSNVFNTEVDLIDKKVAAFYYGWYSNETDYSQTIPFEIIDDNSSRHWANPDRGWYPPANACTVNTPHQGYFDSADPATIETHLRQAEWAGIDAFVVSYWGRGGFEFNNFKTMLEVAKQINSNVSLSLYFEIFQGGLGDLGDEEAIKKLETEFAAIYTLYSNSNYSDLFWYEDDLPVLFVYVVKAVSSNTWTAVVDNLAAKDHSFFLVADRPGELKSYNQNFQGVHQYDNYAPTRDDNYFETYLSLKKSSNKFNQVFCAGVSPGYNDTVVRDGNVPFGRENGNFYKNNWNEAISLNPDWITITSWNEWHEGTEIEPSLENGNLALNQTKQYISEFKSGEYRSLTHFNAINSIRIPWILVISITWIMQLLWMIWNPQKIHVIFYKIQKKSKFLSTIVKGANYLIFLLSSICALALSIILPTIGSIMVELQLTSWELALIFTASTFLQNWTFKYFLYEKSA